MNTSTHTGFIVTRAGYALERHPVSLDKAAWGWVSDTSNPDVVRFQTAQEAEEWITQHDVFARGADVISA